MNDILNNSIYATGVGLLQYAKDHQHEQQSSQGLEGEDTNGPGMLDRMKNWFSNNF